MSGIAILGIFVADLAFEAKRLPKMGETLLGEGFRMGPGGKGSNQAVAAARAGGNVTFITRLGEDAFADIALKSWTEAGVDTGSVIRDNARPTGAAFIFVSTETRDNAIIVEAGAAGALSVEDVERAADAIRSATVFITQLEQPIDAAERGLAIARAAGITTILNPAPAAELSDQMLSLVDYLTPNEAEAAELTGMPVESEDEVVAASRTLRERGVKTVVMTLGARGAYYSSADRQGFIATRTADVVDTTGAGDSFNGAFAVALSEGRDPFEAVAFANAAASLSVEKAGTAPAMPGRAEIDAAAAGLVA